MNGFFKNITGLVKVIIFTALIIVIAVIIALFIVKPWKEETIKIGAILSLTGATGAQGEDVRDGMLIATEEINAWGGINGRRIELIIADSRTDPQVGIEAFKNLEAAHHPVLYVSMISSVCIALAPLAETDKVVLMGLSTSAPKLTEQRKWVFRYWPLATNEAPPILMILQELRVRKLGLLYLNDEYGMSILESIKGEFEKTNGKVVSRTFEVGDTNYRDQIEELKDTEAIFVVGFPSHFLIILKQLKEEDFQGHILATSSSSDPSITGMPEANSMYLAAPMVYNPNFPFSQKVGEKFEARFARSFNHFAANGYDLIKLLAGLLEGEEISRETVRRVLESDFVYSGVFGTLNKKNGEHDIGFPLHPAQIIAGELEYLR